MSDFFSSHYKFILLLAVIVLVTVFTRLAVLDYVVSNERATYTEADTPRYVKPAIHLLENKTLAIDPHSVDTGAIHTAPGYSVFIAIHYKVWGYHNIPLLVSQVIVSSLSVILIACIAAILWNQSVAILVALLFALSPLQSLYSVILLSETLYIFFVLLFLLFAVKLLMSTRQLYLWAGLFGLFLALSTFVRPTGYYLAIPVVLGLMVFSVNFLNWSIKDTLFRLTTFVLPIIVLFSAWQYRNAELTGVNAFTDTNGTTLLTYVAAGVLMKNDGVSREQAEQKLLGLLPDHFSSFSEKMKENERLAKKIIKDNVSTMSRVFWDGLRKNMLGIGFKTFANTLGFQHDGRYFTSNENAISNFIGRKTGYQLTYLVIMGFSGLYLLTIYVLAISGFFYAMLRDKNKVVHLLLLGVAAYFIIITAINVSAYHRFRLPAMPIFVLYAGYALNVLLERSGRCVLPQKKNV